MVIIGGLNKKGCLHFSTCIDVTFQYLLSFPLTQDFFICVNLIVIPLQPFAVLKDADADHANPHIVLVALHAGQNITAGEVVKIHERSPHLSPCFGIDKRIPDAKF